MKASSLVKLMALLSCLLFVLLIIFITFAFFKYAEAARLKQDLRICKYSRPPKNISSGLRFTEVPLNISQKEPQRVIIDSNSGTAPATFRQVGYLTDSSGSRLPLYGQQSGTRRDRWNYYTIVDGGIKVPISTKNRDCLEEVGCDELDSGDTVRVDHVIDFSPGQPISNGNPDSISSRRDTYTVRKYNLIH